MKNKDITIAACKKEYKKLYGEHEELKQKYAELEKYFQQLQQQQQQQQQQFDKKIRKRQFPQQQQQQQQQKRYIIEEDDEDDNEYIADEEDYDDNDINDNDNFEIIKIKKKQIKNKTKIIKKIIKTKRTLKFQKEY